MIPALLILCLGQLTLVPYEQARVEAETSDKPLMVFVHTDDCPPCIVMRREVLEPMATAGELKGLIVATLAPGPVSDEMKVKVTPTLVGFRKRDGQWVRYRMEGSQSLDRVRQFVKRLKE